MQVKEQLQIPKVQIMSAVLTPWPLPGEWITAGTPQAAGMVLSKSGDSRIVRGVWACTRGQFRWNFTYDETLVILAGKATVESDDGGRVELGPGDLAFFERGHWSTWTIHEDVRKAFHADSPDPLPF